MGGSDWAPLTQPSRTRLAVLQTRLINSKLSLFGPSEALDALKAVIDSSKGLKVPAARPLVLAAEENLHRMMVDLDKVVSKVTPVLTRPLTGSEPLSWKAPP